jgi:predicted dehydrogenase
MSRVGLIGCGNIAPMYARTLAELGWVELAAVADGVPERATAFAEKFSSRAVSVEEMLGDPTIEAVINLTPAHAHTAVSAAILAAGKAAFSEKPLGVDLAEGRSLVDQAATLGLRLGCAPDTFLGTGLQAARAAIDRGVIGEPLAASGFFLGFGPEWWHPNPEIFYVPGAGPLFDMGPYYLTALVHLLGPAASISASAKIGIAERMMHGRGRVGDTTTATVPTHVSSVIDFVSGPTATLVTSFDVKASRYKNIEIYGSEGTLALPDPNFFGGPLMVRSILDEDWRELPLATANIPQQRGIGLADMLSATVAGRPHRASGDLALHVLELMTGALRAAEEGRRVAMTTTCERPARLDFSLPTNTFD